MLVQLVLGGAGQHNIHRHMPLALARFKFATNLLSKFTQATELLVFDLHEQAQFVDAEAAFVHQGPLKLTPLPANTQSARLASFLYMPDI